MKLRQAFDVSRGEVVAFVGAGGKTSLLIGLGYELVEEGWRVLATTSTTLREDQIGLFPRAMPYDAGARSISHALNEVGFVLLYGEIRNGLVYGPDLEWTPHLLDSVDSDALLVEADEADGMPFKAPLPSQPRIPPETSLVVPVASLAALGKSLDDESIYNPQSMIDRYGFVENSPVKSPWLAQVLRDEELGLKGVPTKARVIVFINRTPERGYLRGRARLIARLSLQSERIQAVALGSVRALEPVHELQRAIGAIVLAVDDGRKNGSPRMLKTLAGKKTIVAQVSELLMRSKIDHIRVVATGQIREVRVALKALGLKIVRCRASKARTPSKNGLGSDLADADVENRSLGMPDFRGEQLSALKHGLRSMPNHVAATLVVTGDHSRLQPKVIYQMLSAYARGADELLIPRFRRRPGLPVLIGRRYWSEICSLPRKGSLADLFQTNADKLRFVDFDNDSVLPEKEVKRMHRQMRPRSRLKDQSG